MRSCHEIDTEESSNLSRQPLFVAVRRSVRCRGGCRGHRIHHVLIQGCSQIPLGCSSNDVDDICNYMPAVDSHFARTAVKPI